MTCITTVKGSIEVAGSSTYRKKWAGREVTVDTEGAYIKKKLEMFSRESSKTISLMYLFLSV